MERYHKGISGQNYYMIQVFLFILCCLWFLWPSVFGLFAESLCSPNRSPKSLTIPAAPSPRAGFTKSSLEQPNAPRSTAQWPRSTGLSLTVVLHPCGFQPSLFVLLWPQWPRIGLKGSAPGRAVVQSGLCSVLEKLTSKYIWMLTFFSLQSTNGKLLFFFCFCRQFLDSDMPRYIILPLFSCS